MEPSVACLRITSKLPPPAQSINDFHRHDQLAWITPFIIHPSSFHPLSIHFSYCAHAHEVLAVGRSVQHLNRECHWAYHHEQDFQRPGRFVAK